MIRKLLKFYKEELSFKAIIGKERTLKQRLFYYLVILYLMLLLLAMLLSLSKDYKYYSFIPILFFVIDIVLLIKFDYGFLNWHFKKGEKISLKILENYKSELDIKFKTVNDGLFKIRKKKFKDFLKSHKLNPDKEVFILSSLRHKETIELAIFIILFTGYTVAISTVFVNILEFILPFERLNELRDTVPEINDATILQKDKLLFKINGVAVLIIGTIGLVQIFPYFFTKGYFEAKFNSLRNLQELIEDLYLSKK